MWIATTTGYLSIVQGNDDPTVLVVRARVRDDLEPMRQMHEKVLGNRPTILVYDNSDYEWRILTSRDVVAQFLAAKVWDLDYGNFKDAVKRIQGPRRASVYSRVWTAMLGLADLDTAKNRATAKARWSSLPDDDGHWWENQAESVLDDGPVSSVWSDPTLWDTQAAADELGWSPR